MEKLQLSTNLVNAILQYLGKQPYADVFQVVDAIQKEAQAQATAPEQPVQE